MAADIKTISDAIVALLAAQVLSLNERTVATFTGNVEDLAEQGRNLPFVGISLAGVGYRHLNAEESLAREDLTFRLIVVVEDFRGQGFSLETGYGLLDDLRECLLGARLGIDGLSPLELGSFGVDSAAEKNGLAVFSTDLKAWQLRQKS